VSNNGAQKLKKWYSNHYRPSLQLLAGSDASVSTAKSRATNAVAVFASAKQADIRVKMAEKRTELGRSTEDNLALYHEVKAEMFNELDDETRAQHEADAAAFNASREQAPDPALVFA
jgi:hypothetical protein